MRRARRAPRTQKRPVRNLRAFRVPPLGIEPGPSEPESEILSFKLQGHPVRDCKFSKFYGFASILFPFLEGLPRRDALDLHQGAFRERLDGDGAAGREGGGEELGVHLVHGGEVGHVGQENRGLHHVGKAQSRRFEDGAGVGEALPGLDLHVTFREGAGGRVDGQLPGNENEADAGVDGLAVRPDGGRGFFSVDCVHI